MMIKLFGSALMISLTISAFQTWRLAVAQEKLAVVELKLEGCTARALNLLEDKESDDEIDRLTDDDLRNVPDGWLMPAPGSN